MKTLVAVRGDNFYINGKLTYSEFINADPCVQGLLFNSRMIQGIFDDAPHRTQYFRGDITSFDPDKNTDALIAALPSWYDAGLRAITVGTQGGWPVGMTDVKNVQHNPFGEDGLSFDSAYKERLDRIINACDDMGMVVIVNILYWAQTAHFTNGVAVRNAITTCCNHLRDKGYTNVMIDVANEYNIDLFSKFTLINKPDGIATLIQLAQKESGGMLVGSSGGGGMADQETFDVSDVCLVHGNGLSRGQYYSFLKKAKQMAKGKPILCNEDSPCFTRLCVGSELHTSWGYYNNYEKQVPPCHWGIEKGEDQFFADRMQALLGKPLAPLHKEDDYILQGLHEKERYGDNLHTLRITARYPEKIDSVTYYVNDVLVDKSYDEPFFLNTETTWLGESFKVTKGDVYKAVITLTDGTTIIREQIATI